MAWHFKQFRTWNMEFVVFKSHCHFNCQHCISSYCHCHCHARSPYSLYSHIVSMRTNAWGQKTKICQMFVILRINSFVTIFFQNFSLVGEIVYYNRCVYHNFYNRCVCQSESIVQCSTVDSLQSCSLELMWVEVHCRETFLPLAPPPIIRFWQSKVSQHILYIYTSIYLVIVSPLYNIQYTIYMTSARMRWTVRTAVMCPIHICVCIHSYLYCICVEQVEEGL